MTENDLAHLYDEEGLRLVIEGVAKERDFWFQMTERFPAPAGESAPYYVDQYKRYNDRLRDLRNLLSDKFYDR
jgi:hypothetical protein